MKIRIVVAHAVVAVVGCGGVTSGPPDASPDAGVVDASCTDPLACKPDAPRLLAPHSTGIVTSHQPTFRFEAAAKAMSYEVELCSDAACSTVLETVPTTSTSATPTSALPGGVVFWRVVAIHDAFSTPSITWEIFVGHGSAPQSTSWLGPSDFDRNGLTDVALGSASGAVYIMLSQPLTGLPNTNPSQTVTGGSGFGSATANAGDVNGDGYGDLLVGALNPSSPSASLLFGGPSGLESTPLLLPVTGGAMAVAVGGAGDVNGDGYADVLVSSGSLTSLYLGGPTGPSTTPSGGLLNGGSGAGAGDVNADGFADVIVCNSSAQTATVYLGSTTGLGKGQTLTAPSGSSGFGEACITAGDVNGDGYADVVVATQGTTNAYVFFGSSTGAQQNNPTMLGGGSGSGAGVVTSIASAGDVNGDGYGDVIVGAYNTNEVFVYQGAATGVSTTPTTWFLALAPGQYGGSVAGVGDVNGDGFGDVAFAPSLCTSYPVFVYPGSAAGVTQASPLRSWDAPSGTFCYGILAR